MAFQFYSKIYFDPSKQVVSQTEELTAQLDLWASEGKTDSADSAIIGVDDGGMYLERYWITHEAAQAYVDYCVATNACYLSHSIVDMATMV